MDRSRSDFAFLNVQGVAPERSEKLQADLAPGAAHSWNVHLNLDALTRIEGQGGVYANTRRGIPLSGHHLDLEVSQRPVPLRLQLDTLYQGFDGVTTYAGVIDGDDGSLVAISVDGEQVLGKIHHSEGYTYLIQRNYQGQGHTMSIVDQSLIPRAHKLDNDQVEKGHIDISPSTDTGAPAEGETISSMPSSGEVRLLVLYTPAAAARNDINLMANNIVSTFNQSLSLSGVDNDNYLTLADIRSIGDDLSVSGSRCNDEIIRDMRDQSGEFANLNDWMDVAYADIALAIVTTQPSYAECYFGYGRLGGMAILIPPASYPDHPNPFSNVTDTYALADLTAIHEIGHVLNGRHEYDCQAGTSPSYACGYAPTHCDWQTMMGGYGQCGFDFEEGPGQQPTARIGRWSNPSVSYNGQPTGVSGSGPAGRDMAAALDINMPLASTWKGIQSVPPSAPDPITVGSGFCYGFNTVDWTSQSGGVEYRLFQSTSSSFTNPDVVYSGPGSTTNINVSQTVYLRAKACNSGGCSPYSAQVSAGYYPGCM